MRGLRSELIPRTLIPVLVLTIFLLAPGVRALRGVRVEMPLYVRRGQDVVLGCAYELEEDALYAVKWYKGTQEFYRYVPKEVPPEKVFPLPDLTVDVASSNAHQVLLRKVSLELSGTFKCVVSAESPFQTLAAAAELRPLVIGEERPFLGLDRKEFYAGDGVTAHCRAPPSLPPANLTWYLNQTEMLVKTERTFLRKAGSSGTSRESFISFTLTDAPLSLSCRARVLGAYDQNSSLLTLRPLSPTLHNPHTLLRSQGSGFGGTGGSWSSWTTWTWLLLRFFHSSY